MKITLHNLTPKKFSKNKVFTDFKKNPPSISAKQQFLPLSQRGKRVGGFESNWKKIQNFTKLSNHQHILIIGIGGSSLPAQVLVNALNAGAGVPVKRGTCSTSTPQFHFLDNLDPTKASTIFNQLNWKKTLVIVIAKSGETLETLANFFIVKKLLGKNWKEQIVIVTDPQHGYLRQLAEKEKLQSFEIPPDIGGRYSIFTPVGLLPAALAGINVKKLLAGAQKANPKKAFQFAQLHAAEYRRKKNITTFCVYSNALESFGKWYEQLLAESIGKSSKIGITPQLAIGATDQHSKLQLWSDGPNDKFFIFTGIDKVQKDFKIPSPPKDFACLKGTSMQQIINTEMRSTVKSLAEKKRSIATFSIPRLDEENLGELLQFWMLETYFLGNILKVNPFNQPGVERGKILTKKLLHK